MNYQDITKEELFNKLQELQQKHNSLKTKYQNDIAGRMQAEEQVLKLNKKLQSLFKHIEDVREKDLASIAHDLHDDLGQNLTALEMELSWLHNTYFKNNLQISGKTFSMLKLLQDTIKRTQKIARDICPSILDKFGFEPAVKVLFSEFEEKTGIKCIVKIQLVTKDFSKKKALVIYRVLQECLTNVARHSKATKVSFELLQEGKYYAINITDDGIGIRDEDINNPDSFGLLGIKERVLSLNGIIKISGINDRETNIFIKIPI
ncbi:MAG: hypothetical protein HN778_20315 [Prolixibacteraceae bacterium]|jgi:signal transduction histidine kinase|nr:hypothetical protein [Prolixibacteraceae bacterium]MBT6006404.1 hypothetical protein [Prolixibacteraceae bacterium]MBT6766179.1 hypothetical protein [Prolixibacteraceae bacterium]MBT6997574.1 hypothetical protein [Prolixibacteraceae bacterium]MBT7397181.1 hypothetical protein [Prolixibacteraceae bacterium]